MPVTTENKRNEAEKGGASVEEGGNNNDEASPEIAVVKEEEEEDAAADGGSGGEGPPSSPLPWYRSRSVAMLGLLVFLLAVMGLTVGLGVGLTAKEDESSGASGGGDGDSSDINDGGSDSGDSSDPSDDPADNGGGDGGDGAIAYKSLFGRTMELFSPDVLNGYDSCTDFEGNLTEALLYRAALIINGANDPIALPAGGVGGGNEFEDAGNDVSAQESTTTGNENSYGTNNQEAGADEADIIKATADLVCIAKGSEILIWNATTGDEISRIDLCDEEGECEDESTSTSTPGTQGGGGGDPDDAKPEPDVIIDSGGSSRRRRLDFAFTPSCSRPTVKSLLLHSGRLVAIVSKPTPTSSYYYWCGPDEGEDGDEQQQRPILTGGWSDSSTHVNVYDISSLPPDGGPLPLLATAELAGTYHDARSIGSAAHVATWYSAQLHCPFDRHLHRWNALYEGMNATQYEDAATEKAEELAGDVARKIVAELGLLGEEDCKDVVRISLFRSGDEEDDGDNATSTFTEGTDLLNTLVKVSSFNILEDHVNETLSTTHTISFLPSWLDEDVYASDKILCLAAQGYHYHPLTWSYEQSTYFLCFRYEADGSTSAFASAEVEGYVLDQFAMDEHTDASGQTTFNVVTINSAQWGLTECTDSGGKTYDCWGQISMASNRLTIFNITGYDAATDGLMDMEVIGTIDEGLGEENEEVYAVRFVGDLAFVVTFVQTDPFYVIILTDRTNPVIAGELKLPGFSTYLHPVNETLILGVGQDVDPITLQRKGLQITLFNVANWTDPIKVSQYTLPDSWSQAQNEHLAFRLLEDGTTDDQWILILPYSLWGTNPDDGFIVYNVSEAEIKERFRVSQTPNSDYFGWCYSSSYFQPRSVVHRGMLTTIKGHTAVNVNLVDGKEQWVIDLDKDASKENAGCCYYGWWWW